MQAKCTIETAVPAKLTKKQMLMRGCYDLELNVMGVLPSFSLEDETRIYAFLSGTSICPIDVKSFLSDVPK